MNIFKPTIGTESIHQDSNDKGVRIVSIATSQNLDVKSMLFLHLNMKSTPATLLMGRFTTRLITY